MPCTVVIGDLPSEVDGREAGRSMLWNCRWALLLVNHTSPASGLLGALPDGTFNEANAAAAAAKIGIASCRGRAQIWVAVASLIKKNGATTLSQYVHSHAHAYEYPVAR